MMATRDHAPRTRSSVQLVAGLGSVVAPFLVASMIVAAPSIGSNLQAEVFLLPWLTGAFFLTAASLLIPIGRFADARGPKKVFAAGMAVYIASTAVCALAPSMEILIIGRGLTGVGAAMVFGTSIALLSLVFPEKGRGRAIGINVTFMTVGFITGLLAGGLLTYYLGWRSLFLIGFIIAGANLVLLRLKVKGECELTRARGMDPVGMGLFATGLLLSFFGLSNITASVGIPTLVAGGTVLAALLFWERRQPDPIISRAISHNRPFVLAVATNILFQAGAFAVAFLLSLHLQLVYGLDPRASGLVLLASQVPTSIISALSGRVIARIGNRGAILLSVAINVLGLVSLLAVDKGTPVEFLLVPLALVGSATGLLMPTVVNWALSTIGRQDYGVASAVSETARLTGMTLSNVVLISLTAIILGTAEVGSDNAADFIYLVRACALLFLGLTVASAIPMMLSKKWK